MAWLGVGAQGPRGPGLRGQTSVSGSLGHREGQEGPPAGCSHPGVQVPASPLPCPGSLPVCDSASRPTVPAYPPLMSLPQLAMSPSLLPSFIPPRLCLWSLQLPPPLSASGSLFIPSPHRPPGSLAVCFWVIPAERGGPRRGPRSFRFLSALRDCPDGGYTLRGLGLTWEGCPGAWGWGAGHLRLGHSDKGW